MFYILNKIDCLYNSIVVGFIDTSVCITYGFQYKMEYECNNFIKRYKMLE